MPRSFVDGMTGTILAHIRLAMAPAATSWRQSPVLRAATSHCAASVRAPAGPLPAPASARLLLASAGAPDRHRLRPAASWAWTRASTADEDFTYYIVTDNGLGGVWDDVYHTSITPPLHYVFAWFSLQFGGRRHRARPAAVADIRHGAGARSSTFSGGGSGECASGCWRRRDHAEPLRDLVLGRSAQLRDDDVLRHAVHARAARGAGRRRRRWWVTYAVSACAALWCHYTAVFVLAAGAGWALWAHRDPGVRSRSPTPRWRSGTSRGCPGFLEQRQNDVAASRSSRSTPRSPSTRSSRSPPRRWSGTRSTDTGKLARRRGVLLVAILLALVGRRVAYRRRGAAAIIAVAALAFLRSRAGCTGASWRSRPRSVCCSTPPPAPRSTSRAT